MEVAEIADPGRGQGSLIYLRRRRVLLEQVVEQELGLGQGQVLIEMLVLVLQVLLVNLVLVLLVVLV